MTARTSPSRAAPAVSPPVPDPVSRPAADPDRLARGYLKLLAAAERTTSFVDDALSDLDDLDDGEHLASASAARPKSALRADLALVAVLVARAVQAEPGLARRLRTEAPVVTLATHADDVLPLAQSVVRKVVFPPGAVFDAFGPFTPERPYVHLLVNDSADQAALKSSATRKEIAKALNFGMPMFGIAPKPERHLPADLVRAADHHLVMPPINAGAVALVLEAIFGEVPSDPVSRATAAAIEPIDVQIAVRMSATAGEAVRRLDDLVRRRRKMADGPQLSELDGYGEAKAWGMECAADLVDLRNGSLDWAEFDHKGLLLVGPPGTGKTQFAKALAAEAGVPLVATSVAQWNAAAYLSGTLSAIRKSFSDARRQAPCVLFVDEMDGIGDRENFTEYRDYWAQIVNCLLEELAGVVDREGVVVVAATNHPDKIDAAVKRAGRLDRMIQIEKPDAVALARIFRFHLGTDLDGVDLMPAALAARGSTGADVEAWVRRAKGLARRAKRPLGMADLMSVVARDDDRTPEQRRRAAVHEAGHAVVGLALGREDVGPMGLTVQGGFIEIPHEVDGGMDSAAVDDLIALLLAGRAAEEVVFGSATAGAISDLEKATHYALAAEAHLGLGKLGLVHLPKSDPERLLIVPEVHRAVHLRLDACRAKAASLIGSRRSLLDALAVRLDQTGYLGADEIQAIAVEAGVRPAVAAESPASEGPAAETSAVEVDPAGAEAA